MFEYMDYLNSVYKVSTYVHMHIFSQWTKWYNIDETGKHVVISRSHYHNDDSVTDAIIFHFML